MTLPAGALIDRWNRKFVLVVCNLGLALNMGSIALMVALHRLTPLQLAINALVTGTLTIFLYVAEKASVAQVVTRDQLATATAGSEVAESAVTLMSPPLAGALFGRLLVLPFALDALSFGVMALALTRITRRFQQERVGAPVRLRQEIAIGLRWLWNHRLLRTMTLLMAGHFFAFSGDELIIIVLAQQLRATPLAIGMIFAAGGVGGLFGALVAARVGTRWRFGGIMTVLHWGLCARMDHHRCRA